MPLIFDLDGVLIDSEPLHIRAWQEFLGQHSLNFPVEWYQQWVGLSDRLLAERLRSAHGVRLSVSEVLAGKRLAYHVLVARELRPFAGVPAGLTELRARGSPYAIATSSSRATARHCLACTGLEPLCPILVSADDVAQLKPAPDCFLQAANLLGVAPAACIVIEDSPAGLAGARAAGCRPLGVASSLPAESLAEAERIFPSTAAALEWVLKGGAQGGRSPR